MKLLALVMKRERYVVCLNVEESGSVGSYMRPMKEANIDYCCHLKLYETSVYWIMNISSCVFIMEANIYSWCYLKLYNDTGHVICNVIDRHFYIETSNQSYNVLLFPDGLKLWFETVSCELPWTLSLCIAVLYLNSKSERRVFLFQGFIERSFGLFGDNIQTFKFDAFIGLYIAIEYEFGSSHLLYDLLNFVGSLGTELVSPRLSKRPWMIFSIVRDLYQR